MLTTVFGILYTHGSGGSKARGQDAKNNGWIEKAKIIPPTSNFKLLSNWDLKRNSASILSQLWVLFKGATSERLNCFESTKSEASLDCSRNVTTALREYYDFREGVRSTQFAGCFASLQDNELSYLTLKWRKNSAKVLNSKDFVNCIPLDDLWPPKSASLVYEYSRFHDHNTWKIQGNEEDARKHHIRENIQTG